MPQSGANVAPVKYVVRHGKQGYDIYIGRPSCWGNPFVVGKDGDREQVIEKHRQWLLCRPDLIKKAKRQLKGKILGCWCAPLPCHGDVLAEIANEES